MGTHVLPTDDFILTRYYDPTFEGNSVENYKITGGVISSEVDFWGRVDVKFKISLGRLHDLHHFDELGESHFVGGENKCELRSVPECENRKTNMDPGRCACTTGPNSADGKPIKFLCAQYQTCHTGPRRYHDFQICVPHKNCEKYNGDFLGFSNVVRTNGVECICGEPNDDELGIYCSKDAFYCQTRPHKPPRCFTIRPADNTCGETNTFGYKKPCSIRLG